MKKWAAILIVIVGLYVTMSPEFGGAAPSVLTRLIGGWFTYLRDSLPKVRFDWGRILSAVVWGAMFAVGLHFFCRWFYRSTGTPAEAKRWKARWSLLAVGMIAILFTAGTAAVGIAHQIAFMSGPNENIYDYPRIYWDEQPERVLSVCHVLLDQAREQNLKASRILKAESLYSTLFGYTHNRYHLAGIDGPSGMIEALIMYPRDPDDLRKMGVAVATADRYWVEKEKTPREVFAVVSAAVTKAKPAATTHATSRPNPQ